jgi:hypothetical protein
MKIKKKGVALFLTLVLTFVVIFPLGGVNADASAPAPVFFTALGDSTGFGLSAFTTTGRNPLYVNGFNDQFATSLGLDKNENYFNLAIPGDDTSNLLEKLAMPEFANPVRSSTIITVTIGGNNLLGPTIAAICALWGVPPQTDDPTGGKMLTALAAAVAQKFATIPEYNPAMDFMRLMDPADSVTLQFHDALANGLQKFYEEWPIIAGRIRGLNLNAELYVNTVHNPMRITGGSDPLYPLYLQIETLIKQINKYIRKNANQFRYRVVDFHKVFKQKPTSLSFDIAEALTTAGALVMDPKNSALLMTFLAQTDPHPTFTGHAYAFHELAKIRRTTPKNFWTR